MSRRAIILHARLIPNTLQVCSTIHVQQNLFFWLRFLSTATKDPSFTLSYLKNSCGLSQECALIASKSLKLYSSHRPDSVVEFFTSHGFSKSQISLIVKRHPSILLADPERSMLPKVEFFKSKGLSETDIAKMFSGYPRIMSRSLERQIIPAYDYFKNILGSDEFVLTAVKRFTGLLTFKLEGCYVPNIEMLREYGVPDVNLRMLLKCQPRVLLSCPASLEEAIKKVLPMGFNPERQNFIIAVFVRRVITEQNWQRKLEAFKEWGWPEEMVLKAFRSHPWLMGTSVDKIMSIMDLFVNKMGWDASLATKCPRVISMSLKKRLIPRSFVVKVLMSKGLVKKFTMSRFFTRPDKYFLENYVVPFKEKVPGILELYEGKKDLKDFGVTEDSENTVESCGIKLS